MLCVSRPHDRVVCEDRARASAQSTVLARSANGPPVRCLHVAVRPDMVHWPLLAHESTVELSDSKGWGGPVRGH
eukprot:4386444-Prymnesium_polylepis.1